MDELHRLSSLASDMPRLQTEEAVARGRLAHAQQQQQPGNYFGVAAAVATRSGAALAAADLAPELYTEAPRFSVAPAFPKRSRDWVPIADSIPASDPTAPAPGERELIRLELEERARRRSSSLAHRALGLGAASWPHLYESCSGPRPTTAYYGALSTQLPSSFQAGPIFDNLFTKAQAHKAESRARASRIAAEERALSARAGLLQERMAFQELIHLDGLAEQFRARAAPSVLHQLPPPPEDQPYRLAQSRLPQSSAHTASGVTGSEGALPMATSSRYYQNEARASDLASTARQSGFSSTMLETGHPGLAAAFRDSSTIASTRESSTDKEVGVKDASHRNVTLFLASDSIFLAEAQCFLRSTCIELFVSTEDDVRSTGKGARPSRAGQAGLRCIHCRDLPRSQQANQAVCYPFKCESIIESMRNFQRVHLNACPSIPDDVKARFTAIVKRGHGPKRSQVLVRAYYAQAASEVGLVNTPRGLELRDKNDRRKEHDPPSKEMLTILMAAKAEEESASVRGRKAATIELLASLPTLEHTLTAATTSNNNDSAAVVDQEVMRGKFESIATTETRQVLAEARAQATPFVLPSDFPAITDQTYLLFHQLLPFRPTLATAKRRRLNPENLPRVPGLCCRHCHQNESKKGMYFTVDIAALGDSSFSQTLGLHLATCPYAPREIKEALAEFKVLAKEHNVCAKRGSRKIFIKKVWERMEDYSKKNWGIGNDHEDDGGDTEEQD